jgi:hypothetical protein
MMASRDHALHQHANAAVTAASTTVGAADRLRDEQATAGIVGGSNSRFGSCSSPFGINGLEMVDQNRASWNPLLRWLRSVDELRPAA